MRLSQSRVASLLFAASAVGPLGVWAILLFGAVPTDQTSVQHVASMLAYVFTDADASWLVHAFYLLLAVLPVFFAFLSVQTWRSSELEGSERAWRLGLGIASTVAALVVFWPVVITSLMATYYGGTRAKA